ncbi:MAG: family 78 glycoside hydrolase catalytic domain [Clostridia bacterium]|nr:family 78 glycoside hydrolase catalytic domain [Clostridia bacterium]
MEKAKWIWAHKNDAPDKYCEFVSVFNASGKTSVDISCDGDYVMYINGAEVATNQYGDYPHFKVFDSIDITDFIKEGENRIAFNVWHFGVNTQRYVNAQAGLIFEVKSEDKVVCYSCEKTQSRISRAYISGKCQKITNQLGCTFFYDANKEDDWINGNGEGFANSVAVEKTYELNPRPNKKLVLTDNLVGKAVITEKNRVVFDMGEEVVGLVGFSFNASEEVVITGVWSEHFCDDGVTIPRIIGSRDFSFEYTAKKGKNEYRNPFLRLGCRYVELNFSKPITDISVYITKQEYPIEEIEYTFDNELDKRIYDVSVRTLRLCMMEHFVDCPWREQNLYVFDSRNQMLFGYKAFKNGNAEYVKSNLLLMSKDNREDDLLEICYPSGCKYPIPSFSLYWALALNEYLKFSGDTNFLLSVFDKLTAMLTAFANRIKNGLLTDFDDTYWSFYDWTDSNDGGKGKKTNALLNILFVLAVKNYDEICKALGKQNVFDDVVKVVKNGVEQNFYNKENGLYANDVNTDNYTVLTQALAILALDISKERKQALCKAIVDGKIENTTLSFKTFVYDALLSVDKGYKDFILAEIRTLFSKMLDAGATSFWETMNGWHDFHNAGSLCHGWSAIAVYYYNILGVARRKK